MSHRAVLMSIKPKYADLIFSGTKTIELRRGCPKVGSGDLVLVYVSSPRMALVGGFEVAGIVFDEPSKLCKKWQKHSGVENETFLHYFQGSATAYGILIAPPGSSTPPPNSKPSAPEMVDSTQLSRIAMSGAGNW